MKAHTLGTSNRYDTVAMNYPCNLTGLKLASVYCLHNPPITNHTHHRRFYKNTTNIILAYQISIIGNANNLVPHRIHRTKTSGRHFESAYALLNLIHLKIPTLYVKHVLMYEWIFCVFSEMRSDVTHKISDLYIENVYIIQRSKFKDIEHFNRFWNAVIQWE